MARWDVGPVIALAVLALVPPASTPAQATDCSAFDSQVWAQSVFESDPTRYAALDPDGNSLACENLPVGAAPALWTTEIPAGAEPAQLVSVPDGDTIRVMLNGQNKLVHLILIDTPETNDANNPPECYGAEAYYFLNWLLSLGGTLYLERDVSDTDRFDRLLRYAWLDFGNGEVYLVNEAMVRSGYAAQSTFPPDVKYEEEIREAARFARERGYGLWSDCVTDAEGDTNELSASPTAPLEPEQKPVSEEPTVTEPVPAATPPEQVIISDPPEAFGCDPTSTDGCTLPAP